MIPQILR